MLYTHLIIASISPFEHKYISRSASKVLQNLIVRGSASIPGGKRCQP